MKQFLRKPPPVPFRPLRQESLLMMMIRVLGASTAMVLSHPTRVALTLAVSSSRVSESRRTARRSLLSASAVRLLAARKPTAASVTTSRSEPREDRCRPARPGASAAPAPAPPPPPPGAEGTLSGSTGSAGARRRDDWRTRRHTGLLLQPAVDEW